MTNTVRLKLESLARRAVDRELPQLPRRADLAGWAPGSQAVAGQQSGGAGVTVGC